MKVIVKFKSSWWRLAAQDGNGWLRLASKTFGLARESDAWVSCGAAAMAARQNGFIVANQEQVQAQCDSELTADEKKARLLAEARYLESLPANQRKNALELLRVSPRSKE